VVVVVVVVLLLMLLLLLLLLFLVIGVDCCVATPQTIIILSPAQPVEAAAEIR
jgi:hypothetical protein